MLRSKVSGVAEQKEGVPLEGYDSLRPALAKSLLPQESGMKVVVESGGDQLSCGRRPSVDHHHLKFDESQFYLWRRISGRVGLIGTGYGTDNRVLTTANL
jgi:hypothetical protein